MVSLDAVDNADIDFLLGMPHFAQLAAQGTLVRNVESVFISNTYPAHTSIITGVYPEKHGITENLQTQPGRESPEWQYKVSRVQAPTLYEKAEQAGLSVCSILYPVTCGAKIRWNIPETPGEIGTATRAIRLLTGGSTGFILSSLWHNRQFFHGMAEPALDELTTRVAANAIRRRLPNLLMLHLIDADEHKHLYGPGSEQVKDSLRRLDARIGLLMQAMRETLPAEDFSVLLFSDHGCLPVHNAVDPNAELARLGLIYTQGGGKHFDAFFHNAGGTTFLKVLNPAKTQEAMRAATEISRLPFFGRMLTEEEMRVSGMSDGFACGMEAAEGYCFGEMYKGQHGYALSHAGYRPFYLAAGPGIAKNKVREGGCIVDICPLAADLLDIPQWEMDGRNRILEE